MYPPTTPAEVTALDGEHHHTSASRTSLVSVLVAGFTALRSFPAPTDVGSDLMLQAVDVTGSNETVGCHS